MRKRNLFIRGMFGILASSMVMWSCSERPTELNSPSILAGTGGTFDQFAVDPGSGGDRNCENGDDCVAINQKSSSNMSGNTGTITTGHNTITGDHIVVADNGANVNLLGSEALFCGCPDDEKPVPTPTPTPTPTPPPPQCVEPPDGMVAWWPGDGNPEELINENNGNLSGDTTFVSGKVGESFGFNGNGYVSVPSLTNLLTTPNSVTVDMWIYPTSVADSQILMAHVPQLGGGIELDWNINGNTLCSLGNGTWHTASFSNADIALNEWHMLACTYDGSKIKFYLDGTLKDEKMMTGNIAGGNQGTTLGGYSSITYAPAGSFKGSLDEVEIFDRALTQEEIQSIVDAGEYGKCKPTPKPQILVYTTNPVGSPFYTKQDFDTDLPTILQDENFQVIVKDRETSGPITDSLLAGFDQLWIMTVHPGATLTAVEKQIINDFRANNKGVLIAADHKDFIADANLISQDLGVQFTATTGVDRGFNGNGNAISFQKLSPTHPIVSNVNTVAGDATEGNMVITSPALMIASTLDSTNIVRPFSSIWDDSLTIGRVVFDAGFLRFADAESHASGVNPCDAPGNCWSQAGDTPQYIKNIANWLQRNI